MELTRRRFLQIMGAGAGTLGLIPLPAQALQEGASSSQDASGIATLYTTCGMCASHCAMIASVKDGRLIKLEGNPDDQHGRGRLCGKGNAGISLLYDPDRLKYPLKRTNPEKGVGVDPKWKRISWDEALDTIAAELTTARDQFGARSIAWLGYHVGKDLLRALGSPNDLCHHTKCNSARVIGNMGVFGQRYLAPDLSETRYILGFGWDMPGKAKNVFAGPFAEGIANGAKAVIFDPRQSATAAMAAEWIPIRPGTDIAVALAMIHYIIRNELYDKAFVEENVYGFDRLAESVRDKTPKWAALVSDVPAQTIERIAREFATTKPACLPHYKRGVHVMRREGLSLVHAENILCAITGNIEVVGGMFFPRTPRVVRNRPKKEPPELDTYLRIDGAENFPVLNPHPLSGDGLIHTIAEGILNEDPYALKALIVYKQSLFAFSNPNRVAKAFAKVPFVVNINIYPDEMACLADIVLPDRTYLERKELNARNLYAKSPQISVFQPVVEPLYEARELDEIKAGIAERMGIAEYMPEHGEAALNEQLKYLEMTYQELKGMGLLTFRKRFRPQDLTKLPTVSGKIEVYSQLFDQHGYDPLPVFREAWVLTPTKDYPFYFTTTRSPLNFHCTTENIPWIHEMVPENMVWINAAKARELGIKQGHRVRVESMYGQIVLKAFLTEGIRPDTVCVPHGYGHWSKFLTRAAYHGANDGDLMNDIPLQEMIKINDPSANAADSDILVRISKV
ncbi:MAG: molybdopterin-containing oxidoreductase family protein [bacterium]